jgi:hypothetical protein
MRILIAIPALLVLGACNVSKEGNAVTVQYDQNTAENTADKVQNKVGNGDVSVNVNENVQTNATGNKSK